MEVTWATRIPSALGSPDLASQTSNLSRPSKSLPGRTTDGGESGSGPSAHWDNGRGPSRELSLIELEPGAQSPNCSSLLRTPGWHAGKRWWSGGMRHTGA